MYFPPATDVNTGEEVAVKLEHAKTKYPQLNVECKFYKVTWTNNAVVRGEEIGRLMRESLRLLNCYICKAKHIIFKLNTDDCFKISSLYNRPFFPTQPNLHSHFLTPFVPSQLRHCSSTLRSFILVDIVRLRI